MANKIREYYDDKTLRWFDLLLEGIMILDENMVVEYVNSAYLEYSKLKKEEIVGKDITKVRSGSLSPRVYKDKKALYNEHRIFGGGVESYTDILPIIENDEVIGALIVVRDVKVLNNLFARISEKDKHISQLHKRLKTKFKVKYTFESIVGIGSAHWMTAKRAAITDSSILLVGESGTGKEVLAQAIHAESLRRDYPFVDINCAALPEHLLESELFGYAPGAFSGANKAGKIGLFELANGGTIFLDEITEMPLTLQSKLLRALQEKQIRRIGDNENISLDVRIIAATNQNIDLSVSEKRFRSDLFYRIAVIVIQIPPLRDRIEEIDEYIKRFIMPFEIEYKKNYDFSSNVLNIFKQYSWPGNIRQLRNAIEYISMTANDGNVTYETLPYYLIDNKAVSVCQGKSNARPNETLSGTLGRIEKEILQEMLSRYGEDITSKNEISQALGISLATLYNKLKKYELISKDVIKRN